MEGFALRDAGDEARAPLALRPVHLALVAFVVTLPAYAPTMGLLPSPSVRGSRRRVTAAVTSSAVVLLRGLQRPRKVFSRARVTTIAAVAYLLGTMGVLASVRPCARRRRPWAHGRRRCPAGGRMGPRRAVPIDQALVLCAFVVLTASFVG